MFWPTTTRVAIKQQDHPTWKGKVAPTNGQGLEIASRVKSNVEMCKREQSLAPIIMLAYPHRHVKGKNMNTPITSQHQPISPTHAIRHTTIRCRSRTE
jgi:hypothetical protein